MHAEQFLQRFIEEWDDEPDSQTVPKPAPPAHATAAKSQPPVREAVSKDPPGAAKQHGNQNSLAAWLVLGLVLLIVILFGVFAVQSSRPTAVGPRESAESAQRPHVADIRTHLHETFPPTERTSPDYTKIVPLAVGSISDVRVHPDGSLWCEATCTANVGDVKSVMRITRTLNFVQATEVGVVEVYRTQGRQAIGLCVDSKPRIGDLVQLYRDYGD
jgi:hypothetical protein